MDPQFDLQQGDTLINICYKNMISLGKGQCGENSHCVNSLKVIYISSLEEWIPLDSCRKREELMLSVRSHTSE